MFAASVSVTDGDTLAVDGEKIRIATIDAPEILHAQCDAERRLAIVAKHRLEELVAGGPVVVHRGDPATGRTRDRSGRTLDVVTVFGRDVGLGVVAEGLAPTWFGRRELQCE